MCGTFDPINNLTPVVVPAYHCRSAHPGGADHSWKELRRIKEDDAQSHRDCELASNGERHDKPAILWDNYDAQEQDSCMTRH